MHHVDQIQQKEYLYRWHAVAKSMANASKRRIKTRRAYRGGFNALSENWMGLTQPTNVANLQPVSNTVVPKGKRRTLWRPSRTDKEQKARWKTLWSPSRTVNDRQWKRGGYVVPGQRQRTKDNKNEMENAMKSREKWTKDRKGGERCLKSLECRKGTEHETEHAWEKLKWPGWRYEVFRKPTKSPKCMTLWHSSSGEKERMCPCDRKPPNTRRLTCTNANSQKAKQKSKKQKTAYMYIWQTVKL